MPYVDVEGKRIFYALHDNSAASDTPLLLIHGAGYHHLVWPAALRRMPGLHVIAIDLPGHYKSEGMSPDNISEYAVFIARFLDALQIDHVLLGGHSMGGAIAQHFAAIFPARVAALILIATAARFNIAPDLMQLIASDRDAAIDRLGHMQWGSAAPAQLKRLSHQQMLAIAPETLRRDYVACAAFDIGQRLNDIRAPVLVIAGSDDMLTPLSEVSLLARHLPDAKLKIVEDVGHLPMLERDIEVARAMETFLREAGLLAFE